MKALKNVGLGIGIVLGAVLYAIVKVLSVVAGAALWLVAQPVLFALCIAQARKDAKEAAELKVKNAEYDARAKARRQARLEKVLAGK